MNIPNEIFHFWHRQKFEKRSKKLLDIVKFYLQLDFHILEGTLLTALLPFNTTFQGAGPAEQKKLVGTSLYGGHNLHHPGWNRVKVAVKRSLGRIPTVYYVPRSRPSGTWRTIGIHSNDLLAATLTLFQPGGCRLCPPYTDVPTNF